VRWRGALAGVDGHVFGGAQGPCDKKSGSVYVRELCDLSDAVLCYNSFNGMHMRYVDSSLQEWYKLWDRDVGKEDEYYYSTTLKGMVC
jgi:hypothetical protein